MPSIIAPLRNYYPGECPVFVAFVYREMPGSPPTKIPLTTSDIASIRVTHFEERIGLKNGIRTRDWFPVENFNGVEISITDNFFDTLVATGDAFAFIDGMPFAYNFLYIPRDGNAYYPQIGKYQTVFYITLTDGSPIEIVTYGPLTVIPQSWDVKPVRYGDNAVFSTSIGGGLYAKYKEQSGEFNLKNDRIYDIYLTVFDAQTKQVTLERTSIFGDIPSDVELSGTDFQYTFSTRKLPLPGFYQFKFEVESAVPNEDTFIPGEVLCVFDVELQVTS